MKKIYSAANKISVKLFLITAFTFTSILVAALYAQSYYFQQTYIMTRSRRVVTDYNNLANDIDKGKEDIAAISKTLNRYKTQYQLEGIVFTNDGQRLKYSFGELVEYQPSALLDGVISLYYQDILPAMEENFATGKATFMRSGGYHFSDGHVYNDILTANLLENGEVLLAVGPYDERSSPGIIDQYFSYVLIIGAVVSVTLSFAFSFIVSRPLVGMNAVAKNMAALDFSKKVKVKGTDEIGQLAQSLNTLSENLDQTLKALTQANAQLESDIEREKSLEKTRKEFVTNISHELKTPITIVQGFSQALKDNIRQDKREHYTNQIIIQADHMSKLVQDMLDLSKIESGQYQPVLTDFNLAVLTADILERLSFPINEKKLKIHQSFPGENIMLQADRLKISQVIVNFLDNAVRYTPYGGNIYISIEVQDAHIRFSVENEGEPVDPSVIDKLWDRFYRETGDRSKKTGGTGLGLAISSKILEMHQMAYGVNNTKVGVVFYFIAKVKNIDDEIPETDET